MNIIELARQAGFQNIGGGIRDNGEISDYWDCWPEQLERFAALVREECAKVCDDVHAVNGSARDCAKDIRGVNDE